MELFAAEFLNIDIMVKVMPMIVSGFLRTLLLCVILIPVGWLGGIGAMLLSTSRSPLLRWPAVAAIDFFRSFPPLVLIVFIYAGFPFLGLELPAMVTIVIAFLLNSSSYYGEIFRAGVLSVPPGQAEAARSTGMTQGQAFLSVVLPQAVRNVLPELVSNTVELVKLTTLASVVSVPELLHSADLARSLTYNSSPLVLAALIYLVCLWPLVRLAGRLEHRLR
jgi:polar amino acid transport system permease protein